MERRAHLFSGCQNKTTFCAQHHNAPARCPRVRPRRLRGEASQPGSGGRQPDPPSAPQRTEVRLREREEGVVGTLEHPKALTALPEGGNARWCSSQFLATCITVSDLFLLFPARGPLSCPPLDLAIELSQELRDVGIPARPALALPAVGRQRRFPGSRARPCGLCRAALPAARRRCPVPRARRRAWAWWAWAWRARARAGSDGAGTTGY